MPKYDPQKGLFRVQLVIYSKLNYLHYITCKIYKALLYKIGQERQPNINRQWSHASLQIFVSSLRLKNSSCSVVGRLFM